MSSASSAGGGGGPRVPLEEDLHYKLQTLQDMFTSTRPVSVLYLRGDELDDPDLHPVTLPGESLDPTKVESRESTTWRSERSSVAGSSLVSPSPSSLSLHSQVSVSGPKPKWQEYQGGSGGPSSPRQGSNQPTKIPQTDDAGNLTGWIETLGVDSSYRPPPERTNKPVACFYIARRDPANPSNRQMHRAIYIMQRTLREFVARIAHKWNFDANKVARTVHVLPRGIEVEIDDDLVRELPEGQDMTLEINEANSPIKQEWEMAVDAPGETEMVSTTTTTQRAYELRLTF